jgi:hypothetical protein
MDRVLSGLQRSLRAQPKPRGPSTGAGRRAIGSLRLGSEPSRLAQSRAVPIYLNVCSNQVGRGYGAGQTAPSRKYPRDAALTGTRWPIRTVIIGWWPSPSGELSRAWHCLICKATVYDQGNAELP